MPQTPFTDFHSFVIMNSVPVIEWGPRPNFHLPLIQDIASWEYQSSHCLKLVSTEVFQYKVQLTPYSTLPCLSHCKNPLTCLLWTMPLFYTLHTHMNFCHQHTYAFRLYSLMPAFLLPDSGF